MTHEEKRKAARALCNLIANYCEHRKEYQSGLHRTLQIPAAAMNAKLDDEAWTLVEMLFGMVSLDIQEQVQTAPSDRTEPEERDAALRDAAAARAEVATLREAIGVMVPTCLRVLLEVLPEDADVDRKAASDVLARVERAMEATAHAARKEPT